MLQLIRQQPEITAASLAEVTGIGVDGVNYQLNCTSSNRIRQTFIKNANCQIRSELPPSNLPTHAFKLLHKSGDFLEHALFLGQVLGIKRTHFRQNGIEFCTAVAGKFPL